MLNLALRLGVPVWVADPAVVGEHLTPDLDDASLARAIEATTD